MQFLVMAEKSGITFSTNGLLAYFAKYGMFGMLILEMIDCQSTNTKFFSTGINRTNGGFFGKTIFRALSTTIQNNEIVFFIAFTVGSI